ncbi:T9SS type A sorting domain-containing protein [Aquimarina agarivorans]|uniref:T9SS type A sorting domain-containing protein n=1 Tax=Aquimarina agarivorans TaxID=980584 RepID=UPI000248F292|nr:T9SS type A sorting domain-containing protein [Aquimarina agarivorans]
MKNTKQFNKIKLLSFAIIGVGFVGTAQNDWDNIPVPANAGSGNEWQLQDKTSDNFNYKFDEVNRRSNFGNGKWYNFYHNPWDGPGTTYWKHNHVSVDGKHLKLRASRWNRLSQPNPQYSSNVNDAKMKRPDNGVSSGCVTSHAKVVFPVFVESAISVANIDLASCFWLLSPDDTQEIDIIENYGGVPGFNHVTHISHHSFIRNPFHDYQPRDWNSWWPDARVNPNYGWGDWAWNNGNRRFLRLGVNWISPKHFEYFVDGELVRVLYNDAIATRMNGTWEYTYYVRQNPANTKDSFGNNIGGMPVNYTSGNRNGYSQVVQHSSSDSFVFSKLEEASNASNGINVVDPGRYQNGRGFYKEMDIIINVESQSWLVSRGLTPNNSKLSDPSRNSMLVDWVRVYKPVKSTDTPQPVVVNGGTVTGGPYTFTVGDGIADNVSGVSVSGSKGAKTGWIVTDEALNILGTPPSPEAVNFDGAGTGVCFIWHIAYEDGLENLSTGNNVSDLKGNYDLSDNSVRVIRNEVVVDPIGGQTSTVIQAESFVSTGGTFNGWERYTTPLGIKGTNFNQTGDYAEFDVTISEDGLYDLSYFVGTILDDTAISLYIDDIFVARTEVVNNGDWDSFVKLPLAAPFTIGAGVHKFRLEGSGTNPAKYEWNMDYFEVTKVDDFSVLGAVDMNIEAESFTTTGGAFNGVQKYITFKNVEGTNLNQTGDWAEYTINVPVSGTYDVTYYISTPLNNTAVEFIVDGESKMIDNVSNNNSWDDFKALNSAKTVFLTAGSHVVRLQGAGTNPLKWEWNLDRFNISTAGSKAGAKELETINADLIKVVPNPVVDFFSVIGLESETVLNYTIVDIVGGTIKSGVVTNSDNEINGLGGLAQGVYFVKIYNDAGFKKVVKLLKN